VEQRVERVVRGDKLTRQQVMERMKNQLDDESKIRNSDYAIYNSEDDLIIPAVLRIHDDLLRQIQING